MTNKKSGAAATRASGGGKKGGVAGKKRGSAVKAGVVDVNANTLPTERDIKFVRDTSLPPESNERVRHGVVDAFTPRVCATVAKEEMSVFYGQRLKGAQIARDAEVAIEAEAVAARFTHGADVANQIGAPRQINLLDQASLIMRDIDEFLQAYPHLRDGLMDLVTWWNATFPGGGPRAKENASGSEAGTTVTSPVASAPTSGAGKLGNAG